MLPARMMRVVFSMLISSTFIEVALGVACKDSWPDYCPNHYNAQDDHCKFDDYTRTNCRVTCGLCPSRTTPPTTSTVITTVPSSTTLTARAKVTSPPTTLSETILHCEDGKFGINCEYTCHCKDSAVCDKSTGSCPSKCDSRWSGEACQIGNAAYKKTAITKRTSVENTVDACRAVDTHDGSCVYMNSKNRDKYNKWLMVDLEHRHVLFNLTIVTRDCYQCQANIFIKDDTNIPSTRDKFCNSLYVDNQMAESNEVVCNKPVIGRYLFMKLEYSDGPMELCDVRVHAYQYKDCPYSEYGPNCNLQCQCKNTKERCDVITGKCPVSFSTPETTTMTDTTTISTTTTEPTTTTVPITSTTSTALTTTVESTTIESPTTIEPTSSSTTTESPTTIEPTSSSTTTESPTTIEPTSSSTTTESPTTIEPTSSSTTTESPTTIEPTSTSTTTESLTTIEPTSTSTTTEATSCPPSSTGTSARTTPPTTLATTEGGTAISLYLYPWTWTDRNKHSKKGKGPPCVIPFISSGKRYDDCIRSEATGRLWCPYVHHYVWREDDIRWGYCPECTYFIPSLPSNITLTTQPAGIGKRSTVTATWKASSSNEECKFSLKYNIEFTTTDGREEYIVNATDELRSEWPDAPANTLIHVSVQSLNCFNYPCKSSEWSEAFSINSSNKYPGPVENMRVTQRTPTSLTLKWDPNEHDQGVFDYKVSYGKERFSNGNHHEVTLRDLKPGSEYLITVTPVNEIGFGENKSIKAWTDIEGPFPPKPKLVEDLTTTNSITVHISPASPLSAAGIEGYVLKLLVANPCFRERERPDGSCCDGNENGLEVDIKSNDKTMEFGADQMTPAGKTVELEVDADKKYKICYGVEVKGQHGELKTKFTEMEGIVDAHQQVITSSGKGRSSGLFITIGASLAACLLLISTIAALVVVIIRKNNRSKVAADPEVEEVELAPRCHSDFFDHLSRHSGQSLGHRMDLEQFLTCVRQMRQDGGALFTEEYQLICSCGQGSHSVEVARANMDKNRYKNILAYDHSRVILQRDDPEESDYINANFIKDREGEVFYIATQGPKDTTAADFWLMVWQQEVEEIVMLAGVIEDGRAKCFKYWPDVSETDSFDFDLTVTCLAEIEMQGFTIRRLQVQRGDLVREIQQFHYMAWPDHGVPPETHSLLAMMKHVGQTEVDAPMLVHCSAGVGRTGTFIAIREILMQGQAEGAIDIMKFVLQMRQSRASMVQTKDQYIYIYTTIGDYLQHRKAAVNPYSLHQHYTELQQPRVAHDGFATTGLDEEFEVLESMTNSIPERKVRYALSDANKEKNRHIGVLPNIDHAVKLAAPGQCSSYINAVYVDGYMLPRAFIVTQIPMANTRDDFWTMVNECGASVLVQMTEDPDLTQQNGSSYLPTTEDDVLVGKLRVQLQSIQTSSPMEEIICRKLTCGHPTLRNTAEITHYSFASYPPSPVAISIILGELDNESQFMSKGPVVSLCHDGAGWSGVLCACHHICKQMQLEETVNVLQCIHRIRTSRPQLVWTKEQYDFCYKVALKFLDSFAVYENLK